MHLKRLGGIALAAAMLVTSVPAITVEAAGAKTPKTVVIKDSNIKDLKKYLKNDKVKTIKLNLSKTTKLSIPAGDYSTKKIIVKAPKTTITNKGTFDEININAIAKDTWRERGNCNFIRVKSTKDVHIKVETERRVSGILFEDGFGEAAHNRVDVTSGGIGNIVVESKNAVEVAATKEATVSTVSIEKAGADVSLKVSDSSSINAVELVEAAGAPETSVLVEAKDQAVVDHVTTSAKDADLKIDVSGEASVERLNIISDASATLTGTSSSVTKVDVTAASANAAVTINTTSAAVETGKGQVVDSIINNTSGKEITIAEKPQPGETSSGSASDAGTSTGGSGSAGSSGGGYSGGGSSSAAALPIETEPGNLIRNGRFPNQGAWMDNYTSYVSTGNSISIGNGAAVFTITNPGINAWDNMLSQGGINMENGERYRLTFTASSTTTRKISVAIANQGGENWYGGGDAELTSAETPYSYEFTMSGATNTNSFIKFSMGVFTTWSGGVPTTHPDDSAASTITIKNVRLEKLEAAAVSETEQSSQESEEGAQEGGEGTQNTEVYTDAVATAQNEGREYFYETDLTIPSGTSDLHNKKLKVVLNVKDVVGSPQLALCVMDSDWHGWNGQAWTGVGADPETYTLYFDFNRYYYDNQNNDSGDPAHYKLRVQGQNTSLKYQISSVEIIDNSSNLLSADSFSGYACHASAAATYTGDTKSFNITAAGTEEWGIQLKHNNITVNPGSAYAVSFTVNSSINRTIKVCLNQPEWCGGADVDLSEGINTVTLMISPVQANLAEGTGSFQISLGNIGSSNYGEHTLTFSNLSLFEIPGAIETSQS